MSKNKHDLLLINAKGLKKLVSRTPIYGEPNTNIDVYHSKTGQLIQRKKVGDKGSLNKEYNRPHNNHNNSDHAHDYNGPIRSSERKLTKKEQREFDKAKKKRRFVIK